MTWIDMNVQLGVFPGNHVLIRDLDITQFSFSYSFANSLCIFSVSPFNSRQPS